MTNQQKIYILYFKSTIDFIIVLIGLFLLLPVFILIPIAIKLDSSGPIFFKQKRIGIHKKPFCILKFRSMYKSTPACIPTHMLQNPKNYITRTGKLLRKTSLDELPQIWNIIIGQMSIIGPRPALWNQYDLIAMRDKYGANDIKPGLTGWAQINGRDELPVKIKANFDNEYVKNIGLKIDLKCFFKTIENVLKKEGIVEGSKEMVKN